MKQLKAILGISAVSIFMVGGIVGTILGAWIADKGRERDHLDRLVATGTLHSLQQDCARDLTAVAQLVVFNEERVTHATGAPPSIEQHVAIDQILRRHGVTNGIGAVLVPADRIPPNEH